MEKTGLWKYFHGATDGKSIQQESAKVLVIQDDAYDWARIFAEKKLNDGRRVEVVQTGWDKILVHADSNASYKVLVEVKSCVSSCSSTRTFCPDFVLIRNEVHTPSFDGRSLLNGFLFADVPSINSLSSISMFCNRAAIMGQLHRINRSLGDDVFPVIPQHFASSSRALFYGNKFPAVVKVGSFHAGAGKMVINDHHQMSDFRSILTMMPNDHCFVEPFITGANDLRIQKIGSHYRAFRRTAISGEWKTNTGTALLEEITLEPRWKRWAEEAAKMFGGLDILTVDAIVEEETGREYILEVNGTSSGLHPDCADQDNAFIMDLVVERLNEMNGEK